MEPTRIFRSSYGRVLTGAALVGAVCAIVSLAVSDGVGGLLRHGAIPALVMVLVWACFWQPMVRLDEHGVTVQNVWRTYRIPWSEVRGVTTRWALEIGTSSARISAWAVPPASKVASRTPGLRTRSYSENAGSDTAENVAAVVKDWAERQGPACTTSETVHSTWHVTTIVAVAVLAAISVIAPQA
ncbi:PH domain-containing protein [Sanguibacter gelidistatuariae]|uniref:PH domain-containing protein n=1 Tax=Sanguibacter gelidistatuariae TaxID=1814289 RepID=A0A1G6MDF8_9MICO|nr:PH domain-containing protein [Sanguibacter gelidistatuariae]SDC53520.1 PH domain-containing protein [Sanguibacter gelidistatuariae]